MAFKDALSKAMADKGIKASELSRISGVTEASISEYLSGKKEPRGRQSIAIAEALNVSLDSLWETKYSGVSRISIGGIDTSGNYVQEFSSEDKLDIIRDLLGLPLEAKGELNLMLNWLAAKYNKAGELDEKP